MGAHSALSAPISLHSVSLALAFLTPVSVVPTASVSHTVTGRWRRARGYARGRACPLPRGAGHGILPSRSTGSGRALEDGRDRGGSGEAGSRGEEVVGEGEDGRAREELGVEVVALVELALEQLVLRLLLLYIINIMYYQE